MKRYNNMIEMDVDLKNIFDKLLVEPNDEARGLEAYERFAASISSEKNRSNSHAKSRHKKAMRVAAYIAIPIAFCIGFIICNSINSTQWQEIYVPYGEVTTLTLADGTELKLNSGTRLTYPEKFKSKNREIFLDGEVIAKVSKDIHKPFIIHTDSQYVKVVGTKFDMKAYRGSETTDVHLFEGKVCFGTTTELNQEVELRPGQFAQYSKTKDSFSVEQFDMDYCNPDSMFSNVAFHKESLRSISMVLERMFGTKVVITDERLANTRIFAFFSNGETIEEILELINIDNNMTISKYDNVYYLSPKQ